jgi:hypothetical protein
LNNFYFIGLQYIHNTYSFDSPQRLVSDFVIASPAGAKQSSDTVEEIASSGKECPPRNDSYRPVAKILVR